MHMGNNWYVFKFSSAFCNLNQRQMQGDVQTNDYSCPRYATNNSLKHCFCVDVKSSLLTLLPPGRLSSHHHKVLTIMWDLLNGFTVVFILAAHLALSDSHAFRVPRL